MRTVITCQFVALIWTATFAGLLSVDRFQTHQLQVLRQRIAAAAAADQQPTAAPFHAQNRQTR